MDPRPAAGRRAWAAGRLGPGGSAGLAVGCALAGLAAVAVPRGGAGDAEQVADLSPGAALAAGVGDCAGKAVLDLALQAGEQVKRGGGVVGPVEAALAAEGGQRLVEGGGGVLVGAGADVAHAVGRGHGRIVADTAGDVDFAEWQSVSRVAIDTAYQAAPVPSASFSRLLLYRCRYGSKVRVLASGAESAVSSPIHSRSRGSASSSRSPRIMNTGRHAMRP
jgi:hypothetical protein